MSSQVREEVIARFKGGIRPCRGCRIEVEKVTGCGWVKCPNCGRGQCWFCGKEIPHTTQDVNNHGCNPNGLLEWVIEIVKGIVPTPLPGRSEVLITTFTGATIKILFSPEWTVLQLKQAIQRSTGYDFNQLGMLTYAGKPLDNGMRLAQYQIRNCSNLVLKTQTNGG
jgi:hypothetical protein